MSNAHQTLSTRHLLGIGNLSQNDIELLLDCAAFYAKANHRAKADAGFSKLVCANLFLEPSTRTKMSFEMACHRLGVKPLNFDAGSSSLKKNETLMDTFLTVSAMKPDLMVVRTADEDFFEVAAEVADFPLVNAGEGTKGHPTQALLDALTIRRAKGDLKGLKVAICGDIAHSRVAASNFQLLPRLGANVVAFGPKMFMARNLPPGVSGAKTFDEALKGADVVMMLRIQFERLENPPAIDDYFDAYGLTGERLKLAARDVLVMHPGPMNRGIEIAPEVADDPKHSAILDQVSNGVAVRMAVLDLLTRKARNK